MKKLLFTLFSIGVCLTSIEAFSQSSDCVSKIQRKQPRLSDCSSNRNPDACNLRNDYLSSIADIRYAQEMLNCEYKNSLRELKIRQRNSNQSTI